MRRSKFALLGLAAVALFPTTAAADDWDTCGKQSGDLAIAACSRAIDSRRYMGQSLARLYTARGVAYQAKGDLDSAMADFDESMRVDPKYARAYTTRGVNWYRKGNLDRAMADFDEAIRLNPEYAPAYLARGIAWEIKHGLQEALADFKMYSQLAPSDPKGSEALERVMKKLSAR